MAHSYFSKLFRQSLINLLLVITAFMLYDFLFQDGQVSAGKIVSVAVPLLIAEIMGVTGFIQLLKRRKEAKDYKYFVALAINGLITLLVLFTILRPLVILINMV